MNNIKFIKREEIDQKIVILCVYENGLLNGSQFDGNGE